MNVVRCPSCGETMKRNGKTSAGKTRWRCKSCGASATGRVDNSAKRLDEFPGWLLSKERQADMPGAGRAFRRRTAGFRHVWPLPPVTGEVCRVAFVDGIYLARNVCVPIARGEGHVLGWYAARSENSRACKAPMARIAPPDVVVADGGSGFQKARRRLWPKTRVQRCTFHAFEQVKRCTAARPGTQAGVDLCALAKKLLKVEAPGQAAAWLAAHASRRAAYDGFLREETANGGGKAFPAHERPLKARSSLTAPVGQGTLFTCVDPGLVAGLGALPAANNAVESANAQLGHMLREHRGLSPERRIKAACWWCCMHAECPMPAAEILKTMPTDKSIAQEMRAISYEGRASIGPQKWGDGLVWEELHRSIPWRRDWD